MPKIPTMSLKTVEFTPAVFTPSQYEYKAADIGVLERSLAQREARMKEATQNKSAIDRALGELELKLNPAESEWFESYKQDIRNQIQSSIDSGDYGAAIRDATILAGSVIQDPRILGRIRSQEAYQKELQTQQARRDRGEISQNTYDWWVANNKYSYTDNRDGNGNYVEASPWQAVTSPVKDINWAEQAAIAFKLITPKKKPTSEGEDTEQITVEDIVGNIDKLLSSTPDGYRQAEQAYNVAIYDFNRLETQYNNLGDDDPEKEVLGQQLEARKKLMYKNGSPINYKEYYARMITENRYASTLAYKWTKDSPNSSGRSSLVNGLYNNYIPTNPYITWKGSNVRFANTYNNGIVNGAVYNIGSRFGG